VFPELHNMRGTPVALREAAGFGRRQSTHQASRMLMSGRRDLTDVARYRTSAEPMQVLSGPMGSPKIHFEAPPSNKVPSEMMRFIDWFNGTRSCGCGVSACAHKGGDRASLFRVDSPIRGRKRAHWAWNGDCSSWTRSACFRVLSKMVL
jgi:hypothetical protein